MRVVKFLRSGAIVKVVFALFLLVVPVINVSRGAIPLYLSLMAVKVQNILMNLLQNEANEEKSLVGYLLEVQLEPAEDVVSNRKSEQLG